MAVPEMIRIAYEPDYRTDTIGRYAGGQFLGSITYAFREGFRLRDGWEDHKRLYVVLHRFDRDGHRTGSDVWCAGTYREQQERPHAADPVLARAEERMAGLLGTLPGHKFRDIAIRPFRLVADDVLFGLVVEQHGADENEDNWAELYPDRLGFSEPWDGSYST